MIEFNNVSLTLGEKRIFDGFDWRVPQSKLVVLTGASGGGKTTLLRMVAGLVKPGAGSVMGVPERIAYLFQEPRLIPRRTVLENLSLVSNQPMVWLESVGLSDSANQYPAQLSGGMRQRVAIARAFAFPAPLLLLDEPFKELDGETADAVLALLKRQIETREQTIVVTHDVEYLAELMGERVKLAGLPARMHAVNDV